MQLLLFLSLAVASLAAPQKFFIVPPESSVSDQERGEQQNRTLIPISLFSATSNVGVPLLGQPLRNPKEAIIPVQSLVKPEQVKPPFETPALSRRNENNAKKQQLSFDEILNSMFIKKPVEPLKPTAVDLFEHKPTISSLRSKTGVSLDTISRNFEGQEFGMFVKLPTKETENFSKKPTQLDKHKNLSKLRKTIFKSNESVAMINNTKDSQNMMISDFVHENQTPTVVLPSIINTSESSSTNDSVSQTTKEAMKAVEHVSESTKAEDDLTSATNDTSAQTEFVIEKLQTPENDATEFEPKIQESISVDEITTALPSSDLSQNSEHDLTTENVFEIELTTDSLKQLKTDDTAAAATELPFEGDLITEVLNNNDNVEDSMATTFQFPDNLPSKEFTTQLSISELLTLLPETATDFEIERIQTLQNDTTVFKANTEDEVVSTLPSVNTEIDLTTILLQEATTDSSKLQEKGDVAAATTELPITNDLATESQNNNDNRDDVLLTTSQLTDDIPPEELSTHFSSSDMLSKLSDPLAEKEVLEQQLLKEIFTTTSLSMENFNSDITPHFAAEISPLESVEKVVHDPLSEQQQDNDFQVESITTDLPLQAELSKNSVNTEASTLLEENSTLEPAFTELLQRQETQTENSSDSTVHDEVTIDLRGREFVTLQEEKITDFPTTEMSVDQEIATEIVRTEPPFQDESITNLTDTELLSLLENEEIFNSQFTKDILEQVLQEEGIVTDLPVKEEIIDLKNKDLTLSDEKSTSEPSITELSVDEELQTKNIVTELLLNEEIQTENIITELPIEKKITNDSSKLLNDHRTPETLDETKSIINDSPVVDKLGKSLIASAVSALDVDNSELLQANEPTTDNPLKETTLSFIDQSEAITTEIPIEITLLNEKIEIDSPTTEEIEGIEVTTDFQIEVKRDNEAQIITDAEEVEFTTVNTLQANEDLFQSVKDNSSHSEKPVKIEDQVLTEKPLGKSLFSDLTSNNENTEATTILPTVETTITNTDIEVPIVEENNIGDIEGDKVFTAEKVEITTEQSKLEHAPESTSLETTTKKQSEFAESTTVLEEGEALFFKMSTERIPESPSTESEIESIIETDSVVEESTDDSATKHNTITSTLTKENKDTENEIVITEDATESILDDKITIQQFSDNEQTITETDFSTTEIHSSSTDSITVPQTEEALSAKTSTEEAPVAPPADVVVELITETGSIVEESKDTTQASEFTISANDAETIMKDINTTDEITMIEITTENSVADKTVSHQSSVNKQIVDESSFSVTGITTELPFEKNSDSTTISNNVSEASIISVGLAESSALQEEEVSLTTTETPLETDMDTIIEEQSSNKVTEIILPSEHDALTADLMLGVSQPHLEAQDKDPEVLDHSSRKVTETKPSNQHVDASIRGPSDILPDVDPAANKLLGEPIASDSSVSGKTILSGISNNLIPESEKTSTKQTINEIPLEVPSASTVFENVALQSAVGSTVNNMGTIESEINNNITLSTTENKSLGTELPIDGNNANFNRLLTDAEITSLLTSETKTLNSHPVSARNLGKTLTINSRLHRNLLRTNLAAKHFGIRTPAKVLITKQIPFSYNGAFVDPKTLVAPQFREFIYENEAPEVIAAKIAFFRIQDGLGPVHNQP